jgi:hypothetical protein
VDELLDQLFAAVVAMLSATAVAATTSTAATAIASAATATPAAASTRSALGSLSGNFGQSFGRCLSFGSYGCRLNGSGFLDSRRLFSSWCLYRR